MSWAPFSVVAIAAVVGIAWSLLRNSPKDEEVPVQLELPFPDGEI